MYGDYKLAGKLAFTTYINCIWRLREMVKYLNKYAPPTKKLPILHWGSVTNLSTWLI